MLHSPFKAANSPDFPQYIAEGCFLRQKSARASLTHGLRCTTHVETLYFPFPPSLALYVTLLFISHCFFFYTNPSLSVSVYEISVFHSVDHFWPCGLRSITFYRAFMSLETALHFNKVSNPLGPSPLKQLQLPRAAEELSRESRSFCGQ